jgi:raffinose/stachyose/melibiose transport system permease protein
MSSSALRPARKYFILYLFPGIFWYAFIALWPIISAFRNSFFRWSGGPIMQFIGLQNYQTMITDELFWYSFKNNLLITIICVVGQVGLAIVVGSLLTSRYVKWRTFHKTVIFFPVVLSAIVTGFMWVIIYNKDYGILNWFLNFVGLENLIIPWLDDPNYIILSVSFPLIWKFLGLYLIIFMAGMTNIPQEIFEVAEIDGANGFKKLVYITLPLLRDTIVTMIMLCIAGNMKIFSHIFVMTGGGPGQSSMVLAMYAYRQAFIMYKLGYGSTIAIGILFLSITMVFITKSIGSFFRKKYDY